MRRAVAISRAEGVRRVTLNGPDNRAGATSAATHLFLLSRTEYQKCAVFLLRDRDTQPVYRLHDFSKALLIRSGVACCVACEVNSADKLYLVIDSVWPDTKHRRDSTVPASPDGAGGSSMRSSKLVLAERDLRCARFDVDVGAVVSAAVDITARLTTTSAILRSFYLGTNNQIGTAHAFLLANYYSYIASSGPQAADLWLAYERSHLISPCLLNRPSKKQFACHGPRKMAP